MRVLWVDANDNPWTESKGWQVLEDFGLHVLRVPTAAEAQELLSGKDFDLLLVRAEIPDALSFFNKARKFLAKDPRRIVLASSEWSKDQFKQHSKGKDSAHRYARIPMPPMGFVKLVADVFGCSVDQLANFRVEPEEVSAEISVETEKPLLKKKEISVSPNESSEVLQKYLRMREEQLEISEGEREELALENERLQKEAHQLQLRMRELEHLHEELAQKLQSMDEEQRAKAQEWEREREAKEQEERLNADRLRHLEGQLGEAGEKYENLRVRVRKDIRKIRENERDLEARLELLRKDSETLLQARDEKVLEMQRKIDALEFDLDQVQDGRVQAQMEAERYLAKLSRVARALHIAVGMIEEDAITEDALAEFEPSMGGAAMAEEVPAAASPVAPAPVAQSPAQEEAAAEQDALSAELAALAADGEPTKMLSAEELQEMDGEPESSSG